MFLKCAEEPDRDGLAAPNADGPIHPATVGQCAARFSVEATPIPPIDRMANRLVTELPESDSCLSDHRIQLWFVHVSPDPAVVTHFQSLLQPEERARASAFRFERLRQNYAVTRGVLRVLIGRCFGEEPAKIRISANSNGKPYVDHTRRVQFNVSHSDDIALIGLAADCEIGVDIEKIRPNDDLLDIAGRFFCPEEALDLMSVEPRDRCKAFYSCWTRKEAYLKATGDGLRTPLDTFRVSLRPDEPARLLHLTGGDASEWTVHSIDTIPSCAAALAYAGPPREIRVMPMLTADAFC